MSNDPFQPYMQPGQAQDTGAPAYQVDYGTNAMNEETRALRYSGLTRGNNKNVDDLLTAARQEYSRVFAGTKAEYATVAGELHNLGADTQAGLSKDAYDTYYKTISDKVGGLKFLGDTNQSVRYSALIANLTSDSTFHSMSPQQQQQLMALVNKDPYKDALKAATGSDPLVEETTKLFGMGPRTPFELFTVANRNRVLANLDYEKRLQDAELQRGTFSSDTFTSNQFKQISADMNLQLQQFTNVWEHKGFLTPEENQQWQEAIQVQKDRARQDLAKLVQDGHAAGFEITHDMQEKMLSDIDKNIDGWDDISKFLTGKPHGDTSFQGALKDAIQSAREVPGVVNNMDLGEMLKSFQAAGYGPEVMISMLAQGGDNIRKIMENFNGTKLPPEMNSTALSLMGKTLVDMINHPENFNPDHPGFQHWLAAQIANQPVRMTGANKDGAQTPPVNYLTNTMKWVGELDHTNFADGVKQNAQAIRNTVLATTTARDPADRAAANNSLEQFQFRAKENVAAMFNAMGEGDSLRTGVISKFTYNVQYDKASDSFVVQSNRNFFGVHTAIVRDKYMEKQLNDQYGMWKQDLYGATKDGAKQFRDMVSTFYKPDGSAVPAEERTGASPAKPQVAQPASPQISAPAAPSDDKEKYAQYAERVAETHGLPPGVASATMHSESAGNPGAKSEAGALGLFQVLPSTAKGYGYTADDLKDPKKGTQAGVRYLAEQYDNAISKGYTGDDALKYMWAAYNWGPTALSAATSKGQPLDDKWMASLPEETRKYVAGNLAKIHKK